MAEGPWYCTCQRAGPLVKECRAIRPRLARTDSREDRRDKNEIIRSPHSAVCRSQADRLELRLALFGFEGTHYTLTYDSVHLPRTFREAMATKRAVSYTHLDVYKRQERSRGTRRRPGKPSARRRSRRKSRKMCSSGPRGWPRPQMPLGWKMRHPSSSQSMDGA